MIKLNECCTDLVILSSEICHSNNHGLDIVERKVCKDCNNKPIGKSQLNDHLKQNPGHVFVNSYCKRYLFHGQRRSHYVLTEDEPNPVDDGPDVDEEPEEEPADWAIQNGERIFELSSILKESQGRPTEAQNDVYVDKNHISHNTKKLESEYKDFDKDLPSMIDFNKKNDNEAAVQTILTIYFQAIYNDGTNHFLHIRKI